LANPRIRFKIYDKDEKRIKEGIDKVSDVPEQEKLKLVLTDHIVNGCVD
jgi:hypothetical protein